MPRSRLAIPAVQATAALVFAVGVVHVCAAPAAAGEATPEGSWPSFRGWGARGVAESARIPVTWDVATGRNVRWRTAIPGLGYSSPVVWGGRLYLTTAVSAVEKPEVRVGLYGDIEPVDEPQSHEWRVYCLDTADGEVVWQRTACRGVPKVKRHAKSSHANPTPATDGRHVVAFFGAEGLYCFDTAGNLLWKKDLGLLDSGFFRVPKAQWGFGSSPVIHGGVVVVQCDVQRDSFLAALSLQDGSEVWRTSRDDVPTWSTPTVVEARGGLQVVVNGFKHSGGYGLTDGREVWRIVGGGDIPVPTPFAADGLVYLASAHGRLAPLYAVKTSATGDVSPAQGQTSNEHIAWSNPRNGAYMQTPILVGEHLYSCRDNGALTCYQAKTGEEVFRARLPGGGGYTASPVAAAGRLYFAGERGVVHVVKAGPQFELLASNQAGGICMATPAIAGDTLYVRTVEHVLAFAGE